MCTGKYNVFNKHIELIKDTQLYIYPDTNVLCFSLLEQLRCESHSQHDVTHLARLAVKRHLQYISVGKGVGRITTVYILILS